ncbi:hypothetical protein FRB96_001519 [Tulasnella sp. 330]|nr:hypothetical protein FRB96_001519 [Tulasnella sp. 330]KAG8886611.1 hypothetical protein FRB97_000030 [Tulasnella sp. 331]
MLPFQRKKVDISSMTEEEQKLFRLYGKLPTHKNVLSKVAKASAAGHKSSSNRTMKYFDSGDYAMSKAGVTPGNAVGTAIPSPENIPHATPSPVPALTPGSNKETPGALSISPPNTTVLIPPPHNSPPAQSSPIKESVTAGSD